MGIFIELDFIYGSSDTFSLLTKKGNLMILFNLNNSTTKTLAYVVIWSSVIS